MSVVLLNALKTCSKEYCEGKQDDPRKVTWNQKPKGGNNPKMKHRYTPVQDGDSGRMVWSKSVGVELLSWRFYVCLREI